jgi:hypothetical protein
MGHNSFRSNRHTAKLIKIIYAVCGCYWICFGMLVLWGNKEWLYRDLYALTRGFGPHTIPTVFFSYPWTLAVVGAFLVRTLMSLSTIAFGGILIVYIIGHVFGPEQRLSRLQGGHMILIRITAWFWVVTGIFYTAQVIFFEWRRRFGFFPSDAPLLFGSRGLGYIVYAYLNAALPLFFIITGIGLFILEKKLRSIIDRPA